MSRRFLAPFRAFGDWSYDLHVRNQGTLVHEPGRMRLLVIRDLLLFVVTTLCWFVHDLVSPGWLTVACGAVVSLAIVRGTYLTSRRQASAYGSGWMDGRGSFVRSMIDAQREGLTADQWVEREATRDWSVISDEPPPWWKREP